MIVVADSTKFGHQSLAHLGDLGSIDRLVVDDGISREWTTTITRAGVDVVVARTKK